MLAVHNSVIFLKKNEILIIRFNFDAIQFNEALTHHNSTKNFALTSTLFVIVITITSIAIFHVI